LGTGRVEEWRGSVGEALRVIRPFRLPVPEYPTVPRFHSPLIEPDVRICRIRLSDQDSCLRARAAARSPLEPEQPQFRVQVMVREA
jgi:hypothetical protein